MYVTNCVGQFILILKANSNKQGNFILDTKEKKKKKKRSQIALLKPGFLCKAGSKGTYFLPKHHLTSGKACSSPVCSPLQLVWYFPHISFQVLATKLQNWHKFQLKHLSSNQNFPQKADIFKKKNISQK